jgi:hypothetical protein
MNKKFIEVKLLGIKQDALDEINSWFKATVKIKRDYSPNNFKHLKSKAYKRIDKFNELGLENLVHTMYVWEDVHNKQSFDLKLKHFNIETYEIEIIETRTKIEVL